MSATVGRPGLLARFAAIPDGAIIRTAFFAMLAGTLTVLYVDYRELTEADVSSLAVPLEPVLPAFDPESPAMAPGPAVTSDFEALKAPMRVALVSDGVLQVTGTIDPGSADRFAAEVEARGEYVETVAFDSPGGSVEDAMAIGRLISTKGYATEVVAGALCASSCPLAFAGGKGRHATPQSAIGVHQIYAAVAAGQLPAGIRAAGDAMSEAQKTTAIITRHLTAMGIDPALWLHALETPPDRLYYLSPDELVGYKLVTDMAAAAP